MYLAIKIKLYSFLTCIALFYITSCNQESSNPQTNERIRSLSEIPSEDAAISDEKKNEDDIEQANDTEAKIYLSPFEAKAVVSRDVKLESAIIIEDMKVPRLKVSYNSSDFVQVLRCAASYKMTTLSGEDIRNVLGRPNQRSALEWAWAQAIEDSRKCKIVGTNISATEFPDLTAPKGEYYYVINPCVSKEHSILGKEDCSYDLTLTYPVKVTSEFSQEIRDKNIELSEAESSFNANIANASQLAKKIEIHLKACEEMVAKDKALLDFKKGLVQFGFLVGAAAVGYATFGGANAAVMFGMIGGMMGSQMFIMMYLKWPPDIANECINPDVVATTQKQRKKAAKSDKSNMSKIQGKYENEFNVQELTKQLAVLIAADGPIVRDGNRVKKILQELYELDSRVITLDQSIAKAVNLGLDFTDPEAIVNEFGEDAANQGQIFPGFSE